MRRRDRCRSRPDRPSRIREQARGPEVGDGWASSSPGDAAAGVIALSGFAGERLGPLLIVAGSPAAATAAQLKRLRRNFDVEESVAGGDEPDLGRLRHCLSSGRDSLVTLCGSDGARDRGRAGTALLASVARAAFDLVGGRVLTGGEMARAVLSAVGIGALRLERELELGITLGFAGARSGAETSLPVIIKAGGFGTPHALVRCRELMRDGRTVAEAVK